MTHIFRRDSSAPPCLFNATRAYLADLDGVRRTLEPSALKYRTPAPTSITTVSICTPRGLPAAAETTCSTTGPELSCCNGVFDADEGGEELGEATTASEAFGSLVGAAASDAEIDGSIARAGEGSTFAPGATAGAVVRGTTGATTAGAGAAGGAGAGAGASGGTSLVGSCGTTTSSTGDGTTGSSVSTGPVVGRTGSGAGSALGGAVTAGSEAGEASSAVAACNGPRSVSKANSPHITPLESQRIDACLLTMFAPPWLG